MIGSKQLHRAESQSHHPIKILDLRCIRIITTLMCTIEHTAKQPQSARNLQDHSVITNAISYHEANLELFVFLFISVCYVVIVSP